MSVSPIHLRGMTWNHSRGYLPLVATAQRFCELHPGVEIVWEKRSLKSFEETPVDRLAAEYDLLVIDHPFVGYAAQNGSLLPLDEFLSEEFLKDQAAHSVGRSHASYTFAGHQWALAIDAAAPVAFWREDLLSDIGVEVPASWEALLDLARRGHVEMPAASINCLMNFYTLCIAAGEEPFGTREGIVGTNVGRHALAELRELLKLCAPGCWERNPIASHELVGSAANRRAAYCPLAYGYSNYARTGYADRVLAFGEPPASKSGAPLRTVLGGTGLAVSALRPNRAHAVALAEFTASACVQQTLYTQAGGQPGHRAAWLAEENNRVTRGYFTRTMPTLDRAFVRPRYCGYMDFQEHAGKIVHDALRGKTADVDALNELDRLYRDSLLHAPSLA